MRLAGSSRAKALRFSLLYEPCPPSNSTQEIARISTPTPLPRFVALPAAQLLPVHLPAEASRGGSGEEKFTGREGIQVRLGQRTPFLSTGLDLSAPEDSHLSFCWYMRIQTASTHPEQ